MPTRPLTAPTLLREIGLLVDGPVRWGQPVGCARPGIFLVELPMPSTVAPIDIDQVRAWLALVPGITLDGVRPDAGRLADVLRRWWLPGQHVLYVGRTAKTIGGRVRAMSETPLGYRKPHSGGHWLRTLAEPGALRIWWAETEAPEEAEDAVAAAVAATLTDEERAALPAGPILPWANLESATGEKRPTGLTGAIIEGEAPPAPGATLRRAAASTGRSSSTSKTGATRATATRSAPRRAAGGSAPATAEVTHLTAEGLDALRAELEELTTIRRPEVILRVKNARELGDLRENADYEAARNEQSFLEGRIQAIEQMLRTAVVIDTQESGRIALGATVVAEVEGERTTFQIVGSTEADPVRGRLSNVSPVGRALIGHAVGDEVAVETPARTIRYRILEVSRG